jgi:hypothetical protein
LSDEKPPKSGNPKGKPKGQVVDFTTRAVTGDPSEGVPDGLTPTSEAMVEYLESLITIAKEDKLSAIAVTGLTADDKCLVPVTLANSQLAMYKLSTLLEVFAEEVADHCVNIIEDELGFYDEG